MKFIFYGASRVRRGEKTRDRFVVVLFVVVAFFLQRSKDAMKFLTTFCHFVLVIMFGHLHLFKRRRRRRKED
jgi:hypothetical protein